MSKAFADAISEFGAALKSKLSNPAIVGSPEDQLRGPLENLFAELVILIGPSAKPLHLVGETTQADLKIRPDYAVTVKNALAGFIELKAPGKGADPRKFKDDHDKRQWEKLKSLPNLLYTDGNAFSLWRDGKLEGAIVYLEGDVETAGSKLKAPDTLLPLLSNFVEWHPIPPKSAKALAEVSARLCRFLRAEVLEQMEQGNASLLGLAADWRKLLFPQADNEQFADGYAQAVTFGLLVARARDIDLTHGIHTAAQELRKSNTLIGTALGLLTDEPGNQAALKTSLDTLTRVLGAMNWHIVSKDKADAWLYFYEDFLQVYDSALRRRTGSYYTPPEVVEAMVRLADEALRSELFERPLGFASPDVTVADPAVGTGTFLLGVLRKIAQTMAEHEGDGAVPGAIAAAVKRVIGFELQFGPFAVAQLRLLAEMQALMGQSDASAIPELRLYITDTLGSPFEEEESLGQIYEPIARSRRQANKIKQAEPIMVVIGNPPYKNQANDLGSWIENGASGRPSPLDFWTPRDEAGLGKYAHHLRNLYVYFWRWAALKVFGSGWEEATGRRSGDRHGVVCFITAAGFLNGPGFARMREELRRDCDKIWVINCTPEGHQPDIPTRIFQDVQQELCIVLAARKKDKNRDQPGEVRVITLPKGRRTDKFAALASLSLNTASGWQSGSNGWSDSLLAEHTGAWSAFAPLAELFLQSNPGIKTHRTWVIAPDSESLSQRWEALKAARSVSDRNDFFHCDDARSPTSSVTANLGPYTTRHQTVASDKGQVVAPTRYGFRSFDRQWIIPDHRLLSRARPDLWKSHSTRQLFCTAVDDVRITRGPAISFTSSLPDMHHYNGRGGRVYPLWADAAATKPNVKPALLDLLALRFGRVIKAEDVMAYIAAVMAHPAFTARFANDLVRPGLRLPITADAALFDEAVKMGSEVIWLHCYGERFANPSAGRPKGAPRMSKETAPRIPTKGAISGAPTPLPETMTYEAKTQRLMIGGGYVENVTQAMVDYEISGKNVLDQWFSYRRRDRTKPVIGDRRPPSPLEKIQPEGWLAEYTSDLLDLLNVLGRVIALEPAQADLLERICAGLLISAAELPADAAKGSG